MLTFMQNYQQVPYTLSSNKGIQEYIKDYEVLTPEDAQAASLACEKN